MMRGGCARLRRLRFFFRIFEHQNKAEFPSAKCDGEFSTK
jgi:hypothetical protein